MSSSIGSPCPNCGYTIHVEPTATVFACPYCSEELVLTPRKQVHLARPLEDYSIDPGLPASVSAARSAAARQKIKKSMDRRRRQSAEMTLDRITVDKEAEVRSLRIGWGLVIFIAVAAAALVLRLLFVGPDPISIVVLAVILLFLPVGLFLIVWSLRIIRLLNSEAEVQKTEPHA